jgi:hypothetical protein
VYLSKALRSAHKKDILHKLPIFPSVQRKNRPRESFDDEEYDLLKKTIVKEVKNKAQVRFKAPSPAQK